MWFSIVLHAQPKRRSKAIVRSTSKAAPARTSGSERAVRPRKRPRKPEGQGVRRVPDRFPVLSALEGVGVVRQGDGLGDPQAQGGKAPKGQESDGRGGEEDQTRGSTRARLDRGVVRGAGLGSRSS